MLKQATVQNKSTSIVTYTCLGRIRLHFCRVNYGHIGTLNTHRHTEPEKGYEWPDKSFAQAEQLLQSFEDAFQVHRSRGGPGKV